MQSLKTVALTLAVSLLVVGAAAAGFIYSGTYNVAATDKHWPITSWAFQKTIHRSIAHQATNIEAPDVSSQKQLLAGAANFDAMCSGCHVAPGGQQSVAARGMYPQPPGLMHAAKEKSPGEIFWVIKNGIKASGMPAWGASHSESEMWAMTAFVKQLPGMSPADYKQMLATSEARGIGHGHSGDSDHDDSGESHQDDSGHGHDEAQKNRDSKKNSAPSSQEDNHTDHKGASHHDDQETDAEATPLKTQTHAHG